MSATITPQAAAAVRRPRRRLRFARDDELVRLLRAGDEGAFEAIFDRHHRGILAFARHMVGSREEAEDVVQHTFIAAHRDLAGSSKPIQLKAWLYTIARNRCLSLLRAKREERALDDVPEPSVEGLASQVQRRQDLRDMVSDLQRLPEDQREALVLSELGALTHEEVAETLGVRKDKVKALVFQARESLASSRNAREADCREIQEQLAVLRGGSLRRTTLRRHVEVCPACAAFKAEVQRQRKALAVILPVAPTLALKETVLGAALLGGGGGAALFGGGAGAAGGGLLSAVGSKSLAAKVMTIAAVAGGATGGGIMAVDEISSGPGTGVALGDAIPSERRAVKMVGDLRERAQQTAAERRADKPASGRERRGSGTGSERDRPSTARRRPLQVARAGEARAVAVAGRPRTTRTRRRAAPVAVASPREAPAQQQQPPPVAALPPTEVGPEVGDDKRAKDKDRPRDRENGRAVRGERRKDRPQLPAVQLPAAATDRKHGGKHEGKRGRGHEGKPRDDADQVGSRARHRPRDAGRGKAPPAPAEAPPTGQDDDERRDGRGDGQEDGRGGEVKEKDRVEYAVEQTVSRILGAVLWTR